jgi:Fe-S-cluster containining protein
MSGSRVRIAVVGESPCDLCTAACCRQNGHEFAALLEGDEVRKFAPFAVDVPVADGGGRVNYERVLPYVAGRCQFLGENDRCTIYEDRPRACRAFQCVTSYNAEGLGAHGEFLRRNPGVLEILDAT